MNEHSSRSHAIFTTTIERSEKGVDGENHVRVGKLHLVDLAVRLRERERGGGRTWVVMDARRGSLRLDLTRRRDGDLAMFFSGLSV